MKFAFHSLIYPSLKAILSVDILSFIKSLGYHGIEIIPIEMDLGLITDLINAKKDFEIEYILGWSLGLEENLISPNKKIRQSGIKKMKEIVDLSFTLGAERVAGLNYAGTGYLTGNPPSHKEYIWAVDAYREVCDYAKNLGMIEVCLEPATRHDSHLINTSAQACEFIRHVGRSNAKILLDTYQMLQEENDIYDAIVSTGKHIGYFHISESHRGTPGTGNVPWELVFKALKKIKYNGWVGIESFYDPHSKIASRTKIWRTLGQNPEHVITEGMRLINRFIVNYSNKEINPKG